jgi:hypothetical protein
MWSELLAPTSRTDGYVRMATALALFLWLWLVGTHLETPYPAPLVETYALPLTRIFLLGLVLLAASWCPTVGILAAFAYITLGADVLFFTRGGEVLASTN